MLRRTGPLLCAAFVVGLLAACAALFSPPGGFFGGLKNSAVEQALTSSVGHVSGPRGRGPVPPPPSVPEGVPAPGDVPRPGDVPPPGAAPAPDDVPDNVPVEEPATVPAGGTGQAAQAGTPEAVPLQGSGPSSTVPTPSAAGGSPSPSSVPPSPSSSASVPAPSGGPAAATAPAPAALVGWEQAWSTADAETMRRWFDANTGPTRSISGSVAGGAIRSQADADRLAGRVVTSDLKVSCTCVLQEFALIDAALTIDGGQVTVRNALLDGRNDTDRVGAFTARGSAEVTVSRVEITGHNDGIRAYATSVSGEYVYIHGVVRSNPRDHHQDGIQTIGGGTSFARSFIDMTGAHTSATLIKPDAAPIPYARINSTVLMGGGYTFHVHDGPKGTPRNVDLTGNLVAAGYRIGLVSTWKLSNPAGSIVPTTARVSGSGRTVPLVDGVRL